MTLRRNILLFHQGALGDFVVTWPLALGLGRVFAQSRLFYVTGGQKGLLAEKALRVECSDVEAGWHHLFSQEPKLPEPAARLLAGAQLVLSFVSGPDDLWATNVRTTNPQATLVTLSTALPQGFGGHITDYLLDQLKPYPVIEAAMAQMLRSIAARGIGLAPRRHGPVVLHPGAGSPAKCWPAERFIELADRIRQSGRAVEVILGEAELEQWPSQRIEEFGRYAQVVRPASLVELMERIAGGSAFVGNDSGPGHLAAILGIPTISIFGPKNPIQWKPLGPDVRVVRGEWDQIGVDQVLGMLNG